MTEGISKETLIKMKETEGSGGLVYMSRLLEQCAEIKPWLLVDENTPRDRNLHLYSIAGDEGYRQWIGRIRPDMRCPPTHYKLLQEDPK